MPDGTTRRITQTLPAGTNKTDAQQHLARLAGGTPPPPPPPAVLTFGQLAQRYIAQVLSPCRIQEVGGEREAMQRMSHHCAVTYEGQIRNHLLPRWGTTPLAAFLESPTLLELEQWFQRLWRTPANPEGYAAKSVHALFSLLKLLLNYGVKLGYLPRNPLKDGVVELPRGATKRQKPPLLLTVPQFFRLMELLPLRERTAVALAGWLGPRVSEAFGLRWEDLDLVNGWVSFRRGVVNGRITPLKTEASRTTLPLPPALLAMLREWHTQTVYPQPGDWVFASIKTSRPLWAGGMLAKHIRPVLAAAGLPEVGWHSFRHSMIAWAKAGGLALEEAKTLARHETATTTSNIYGPLQLDAKRKAQERLTLYINEQISPGSSAVQ